LIDDDEQSLESIRELLTRAGYEVLSLRSPIGVTQLIARENVSAVIVDMTSPVMQGPRFAALLASWERVRDLPVVLISDPSEPADQAVSRVKQVSVTPKGELEKLLRTLDRALALRGGSAPSQSGMIPLRPSVRHYARAALDAWEAYLQRRTLPLSTVLTQLINLRDETRAIGLEHTTALVALAIELAERTELQRKVTPSIEQSVTGMLAWLITLEPDKGRAFDRSLALNMHRTRLEYARDE
jgi:CheY-like chemotaxis protein